jgi:2-polyprenyl-3-methyl-5-hydroxy-6-metoxy-1,4-benzoquinol methylase
LESNYFEFSTLPFLKVKDYAISNEEFSLLMDLDYQILKTDPQPDENKIGAYYESEDYISHTNHQRNFIEKLYHYVKLISLKRKVKLINYWNLEEGKLLDFGAGTGDFLWEAKQSNWKAFGIEPSEKAKTIGKEKGLCYAESLSDFEDHFFDVITLWHVLEHVHDLNGTILELKRVLKPNGTLIVAVPNFKSYDASYYKEFWAAYDVPRHLWHFSRAAIDSLFSVHHMKIQKTIPMYFDSFYVSLLSEKYKSKNPFYIKPFFIGLLSNIKGFKSKEFSSHQYIIQNR